MTTSRTARVAARVTAGLAALFWGFFWFGLIDLLVVVIQDERFHEDYLLESGWGLLYLVLVTVPLLVLVARPGHPVALAQVAIVALAVLLGAAWASALPQLWNGLALVLTAGVLVVLGGGSRLRMRRPGAVVGVLALVSLPAAIAYAAPLATNSTEVEEITNGVSHWPMQASLALAVAGAAGLAAFSRSRLPAWTAGFTAIWLGIESVVYPDLHGSLGLWGGVLAAGWGVLLCVAVEVARRRGVSAVRTGQSGVSPPGVRRAATAPGRGVRPRTDRGRSRLRARR